MGGRAAGRPEWCIGCHSIMNKFSDVKPSYLGVSGLSREREESVWEREDTEDLPREGEFESEGSRLMLAEKGRRKALGLFILPLVYYTLK